MPETDLYHPIRAFLEANGYTVRSEVKDCDITAVKGEDLLIIELKQHFGVNLLIQATQRQRASDSVYVALPRSAMPRARRRAAQVRHLLRRLEVGLILVDLGRGPTALAGKDGRDGRDARDGRDSGDSESGGGGWNGKVRIEFHPMPFARRRNAKDRRAILREAESRSGEYNRGGATSRERRITAYRENAVQIAVLLDARGPMSPKQLRNLGTGPKTLSILRSNFYEWFDHVGRGLYAVHAHGREALLAYPEIVGRFIKTADDSST